MALVQNIIEIRLVDPVRRIVNTTQFTQSPNTCTENTPLLGRPMRKRNANNCRLLSLGVFLIAGLTIGSYLLMKDNLPYPVTLVFDMIDRDVWGAKEFFIGSELRSSDVRNIYVMQTNSVECHNYVDCVAILLEMQVIVIA